MTGQMGHSICLTGWLLTHLFNKYLLSTYICQTWSHMLGTQQLKKQIQSLLSWPSRSPEGGGESKGRLEVKEVEVTGLPLREERHRGPWAGSGPTALQIGV